MGNYAPVNNLGDFHTIQHGWKKGVYCTIPLLQVGNPTVIHSLDPGSVE